MTPSVSVPQRWAVRYALVFVCLRAVPRHSLARRVHRAHSLGRCHRVGGGAVGQLARIRKQLQVQGRGGGHVPGARWGCLARHFLGMCVGLR